MYIDRLRSSQGNQKDMLMMLQNKEDKLIMPDYFATGPHGVHPHPNYPHLALPPFTYGTSGNSKSTNISFSTSTSTDASDPEPDEFNYDARGSPTCMNHNMEAMREMIFRIAAMQPINIDPEAVKPPKRRNVKISSDPQSVAARHRRERISERIRILQRLVPGGTKMDTASMLDEAIHYVKFLKQQVQSLEKASHTNGSNSGIKLGLGYPMSVPNPHGRENYHIHSSAANFSSKVMSSDQYYQNQMAPGSDEHSFIQF